MLHKPLEMPMEFHRLGNAMLKPRQPLQAAQRMLSTFFLALFTMSIKQTIAPFLRRFSMKMPVTVERVHPPGPLGSFPLLSHSARSPFIFPDELDGSMSLSSPRFSHLFASTVFSAFRVCLSLLFCSPRTLSVFISKVCYTTP